MRFGNLCILGVRKSGEVFDEWMKHARKVVIITKERRTRREKEAKFIDVSSWVECV